MLAKRVPAAWHKKGIRLFFVDRSEKYAGFLARIT